MNNEKETGWMVCFGDRRSCLQSCGASAAPCEQHFYTGKTSLEAICYSIVYDSM